MPKIPRKNAGHHFNNGRDKNRQFQKSSHQNKSGDTKGFHRNAGDDSPYEKRYGSSSGMSLCQNFHCIIYGVLLLISSLVNVLN